MTNRKQSSEAMTKQNKLPEPVLIEWVDSVGIDDDWRCESDGFEFEHTKLAPCRSVGYIVKKTSEEISIASHVALQEDRQYCGIMTIPTCAVKTVIKLEEGSE